MGHEAIAVCSCPQHTKEWTNDIFFYKSAVCIGFGNSRKLGRRRRCDEKESEYGYLDQIQIQNVSLGKGEADRMGMKQCLAI